jgi:hypothetical protein
LILLANLSPSQRVSKKCAQSVLDEVLPAVSVTIVTFITLVTFVILASLVTIIRKGVMHIYKNVAWVVADNPHTALIR